MKRILIIAVLVASLAGCRKEDFTEVSLEAASANKGIPVLSEIWKNGTLVQKNFYENGRLARISYPSGNFPREYQYSYRDKDHYAVMTGDYMYYHYFFNEDHKLVRAEVSDYDDNINSTWVRHDFTWEKDRIKTHSWTLGDYVRGNYSGTINKYEYKGIWEGTVSEYEVRYENGSLVSEVFVRTYSFHWHTPFEYRFSEDHKSYVSSIYSNTIKTPSYNTVGFPWGYYSIENANKHDLMNLLSRTWWAASSGMLFLESRTVVDGEVTVETQLRNIVVNKEKLPDSYDVYYSGGAVEHYEYKYVRL